MLVCLIKKKNFFKSIFINYLFLVDDELRSDDENDDDDESFKKLTREPPKQVHHVHSDEDF